MNRPRKLIIMGICSIYSLMEIHTKCISDFASSYKPPLLPRSGLFAHITTILLFVHSQHYIDLQIRGIYPSVLFKL